MEINGELMRRLANHEHEGISMVWTRKIIEMLSEDKRSGKFEFYRVEWYKRDKLHRLDGPAVESEYGDREWWYEGNLHRLDGPAIEWGCGGCSWFINGVHYTKEEYDKKIIEMNG